MNPDWNKVIGRLEAFLARIERYLPPVAEGVDWKANAFRWRKRPQGGYLEAVRHPHTIRRSEERRVGKECRL